MLLRGLSLRRSFTTKVLLFSLVFISFIFYIKFINQNAATINSISDENNVNSRPLKSEENGDSSLGHTQTVNNDKYEQEIRLDLAKQVKGLGDKGKAAALAGAAKEIGERQLAKIALNEELSEHLSYNRTVQDARNPLCRKHQYDVNILPTTSVIIIFYNEPFSVLVRTVHSVLNTCDQRILKEIILVDDRSSNEELHGKLDYYIETRLPRGSVKLIRLKSR